MDYLLNHAILGTVILVNKNMEYSHHIHDIKGLSRNLRLYTNILGIE